MNKTRVVVLGAGHLGGYHLEKLACHPEVELVGVVDPNLEALQRAASRYGIEGRAQLGQLACQADAAIVAATTGAHESLAHQALDRGWHILIEKPLASTLQAAERIVQHGQTCDLHVQVGHVERFNPAIAAALAIADRPRYIVAERLGPFSGRSTDVDVVLDLMIHDLDIVASLIAAPLVEIRAVGVPIVSDAIDMASARLQFADGCVAQLSAGRASLSPSRKLRLFTVERYVSIDCARGEVKSVRRLAPEGGGPWPQISGELIDVPPGDALQMQDADFIRCVRTGHPPRVDGQAGLRAMRLAEAVKNAIQVPLGDVQAAAKLMKAPPGAATNSAPPGAA